MNFYRSGASNKSSQTRWIKFLPDSSPSAESDLISSPTRSLPAWEEIKWGGEIRWGVWIRRGPIPIIFSLFYSVTVSFEELLYILWYLLTPVLAEWPVCCTVWAKLNIFYIIWVLTQKSLVKLGKKLKSYIDFRTKKSIRLHNQTRNPNL